jgi:molecular chaperone DnaK
MVQEAQSHATDDEAKRKEIETRNRLDGLIYSTEKLIEENRDKLGESEVGSAGAVIADAKTALEGGDPVTMEKAYESLTQASHQIAASLYQSASAQPDAAAGGDQGSAPSEASTDDDVVDAEYVDVDSEESK